MTFLIGIASFFGISVLRLVMYATLTTVVTVALVSVRQHYINLGWEKHRVAVEKQDARAVAASKKVDEQADACAANSYWDVITQNCKVGD